MTQEKPMAHRAKRRTLRDLYRATIDSLTSALRLTNVENELGIKLIEAVAADEFQTQLKTIATDPEERQQLRNATIALGQLGVSSVGDVEKMIQGYYLTVTFDISLEDLRNLGKLKMAIRNAVQS